MVSSDFAVNELVFKGNGNYGVHYDVLMNSHPLITANADGVLFCSSNGSSAYNSSLRGPLMSPTSTALSLSFMAPFGVNSVPVVVPSSEHFGLKMSSKNWQQESKLVTDSHTEFTFKKGHLAKIFVDKEDCVELITETENLMESWLPKVQSLFKWETS